jgi:membrane protease YdiL (CAAX protease family)
MRRFFQKTEGFFLRNRESVITFILAVACIFLYSFFPVSTGPQKIFSNITFLLIIPALYIKIILKKKLKDFGLQAGDWKKGVFWSIFFLAILIAILYLAFNYTDLAQKYQVNGYAAGDFRFFVGYEILIVGMFLFLYEFFYRGFILFSFSKKIGMWAILIPAGLFFIFSLITNNFNWENANFLVLSLVSGVIAYKSRSIWYSFITSLVFIALMDAFWISLNSATKLK